MRRSWTTTRETGFEPGAGWEGTLYERLQWADALVCVVTRNYIESLWCSIELAIAKAQGRRILPLAAEGGLVHPLLTATQHLGYGDDAPAALARLADHLAAIDAGGGVAWNPQRAVFPGLLAFDTDDRAVFLAATSRSVTWSRTSGPASGSGNRAR